MFLEIPCRRVEARKWTHLALVVFVLAEKAGPGRALVKERLVLAERVDLSQAGAGVRRLPGFPGGLFGAPRAPLVSKFPSL